MVFHFKPVMSCRLSHFYAVSSSSRVSYLDKELFIFFKKYELYLRTQSLKSRQHLCTSK
jgi:hypothetical protein